MFSPLDDVVCRTATVVAVSLVLKFKLSRMLDLTRRSSQPSQVLVFVYFIFQTLSIRLAYIIFGFLN